MGVEGGAGKEAGAKSYVALQAMLRCLDFPGNNGMSVGCGQGYVKTSKI